MRAEGLLSASPVKPLSALSGLLCLPTEHGENSCGTKLLTAESAPPRPGGLSALALQPGIMQIGESGAASNGLAVFFTGRCVSDGASHTHTHTSISVLLITSSTAPQLHQCKLYTLTQTSENETFPLHIFNKFESVGDSSV